MRPRVCGVLLHISSLPSAYGIGDLGPAAHAFARALAENGLTHWQFLPLTPTSPFIGNSPYSSPSAFAGNPLFISPELLLEDGFISYADLDSALGGTPEQALGRDGRAVDYASVTAHRNALLRAAFAKNQPLLRANANFNFFAAKHADWLDDYAAFMSIKEACNGAIWTSWPEGLKQRRPDALAEWREKHGYEIGFHKFTQFLFFSQWERLRRACRKMGVSLVGDMPIYVTDDSVDVWAAPNLFELDENGTPSKVAGVPPDYFSETGQRWGNPVYRWDVMRQDNFKWWNRRIEHNLSMTDVVRLDHFRGFAGYWEISAEEPTAVNGRWRTAPGQELFASISRRLGNLPVIAEDLGVITPDVRELMADFGFPSMRVLQFAFGENMSESPHIPFNHQRNQVAYTGTHDNQTARQWFIETTEAERNNLRSYLGCDVQADNAHLALIRLALASPAETVIIPMQDILGLGAEGRMNTPSVSRGNWTWRLSENQAGTDSFAQLRGLCRLYGRN